MKLVRFAVVAAAVFACAPSEVGPPLPATVGIVAVGTTTLAIDRLRVAALYRTDEAIATTADQAVTATGTPVFGTLLPPTIDLDRVPFIRIDLTTEGRLALFGHEIKFFAYLDEDGSGSFSNGPDLAGPDRVVAAAFPGNGYAWIPDVGEQLASVPPEVVRAYYVATGDRYTEFMSVASSGDGRATATLSSTVTLFLGTVDFARHQLLCRRSFVGETVTTIDLRVDPSAGGAALCTLEVPTCTTATVADLPMPALPPEISSNVAVDAAAQCRRTALLEALVIEVERARCSPTTCRCDTVTTVDAIITSTAARPDWWPCGEEVDYCESSLPFYRVDRECVD